MHIPKSAGVSIEGGLPKDLYPNHHGTLAEYEQMESLDLSKYFKFGFVRNPWDRLVSVYFFWRNQNKSHEFYKWDYPQVDHINKNNITFKEFISEVFHGQPVFNRQHTQSNSFYTKGLDFIGRFERIQKDFNIACDKIGIPQRELPHLNRTKHKNYTEYYDDKSRQMVADKYKIDVESFGYKFGD